MFMPISLRTVCSENEEFQINNGVIGMPVFLPLCRSFHESIQVLKIYLKKLRHSRIIYGLYLATLILFCLPEKIIRIIV
jgi:hypothetical protein